MENLLETTTSIYLSVTPFCLYMLFNNLFILLLELLNLFIGRCIFFVRFMQCNRGSIAICQLDMHVAACRGYLEQVNEVAVE